MDNVQIQLTCPSCHQPVLPEYYFCPNCGQNLKPKAVKISLASQIGIYLLSAFLPPLGLWPGVKYVMKEGKQAKWVGSIAIVLTLISTVVMTWLIYRMFQNYLSTLQQSIYGL
jgi:hypothetical protein